MTDNWNYEYAKQRNADMYTTDLKTALNFLFDIYGEFTKVPDDYIPLIIEQYNLIRFYADCLHDMAVKETVEFINES